MNDAITILPPLPATHSLPNDRKLQQARKEALSKVTKLQRHLFQCSQCHAVKEQTDWERSIPCSCGNTMQCRYAYIGTQEFDATTGDPVNAFTPKATSVLKAARKKKGMTQGQLAGIFGVSQSFIAQIESGQRPIPRNILEWTG